MGKREIRITALAATLAVRGCLNAAFGGWLLARRPTWTGVFDVGSIYAIADGALGLLSVVMIVSLTPRGLLRFLAAVTCVDAIGTEWLVARMRGRRDWSTEADALFDPLAAAALVSFAVGFVLFANPPGTVEMLRAVAASASGALAVVFLVASVGAIANGRRA
jgi:hypothetical protein